MNSTSSQQPVAATQLVDWLPHRPPMVWIDEVGATTELAGECFVTLKEDGLYFSKDGLRRSSLIEFIAQGFGYQAAAHSVRQGLGRAAVKQKAFLVSVTQCHLHDVSAARAGTRLRIAIDGVKHIGPITLFSGKVQTTSGTLLCEANLKVFSE